MKRLVVLFTLLVTFAVAMPVRADEGQPDYSKKALLQILRDRGAIEPGEGVTLYGGRHWTFHWIPYVAPLRVNNGPYGGNPVTPMVSPFRLLGVDYPARSAADLADGEPDDLPFGERMFRRRMVAQVRAMNAADNRD